MINLEQIENSINFKKDKIRKINLILKSKNITIKKESVELVKEKLKEEIKHLENMKKSEKNKIT